MKIGVIGMGFVGGTTAKVLSRAHEIHPYDKFKPPYNTKRSLEDLARNSEIVFICVPTPMQRTGAIDYSAIHNSLVQLLGAVYECGKKPEGLLVVIRSTATSGTTDELAENYKFKFAFNPEFLREKHAVEDMENTTRIIIGAEEKEVVEKIMLLYKPLFPDAVYRVRNRKTAEMDKYANNFMLTIQALGANVIYNLCKKAGVSYEETKEDLLLDSRIGRNIEVPGPDGFQGVGGKCFPKDLKALTDKGIKIGAEKEDIEFLEAIWRYNLYLRGEEGQDWVKIKGATSQNLHGEGQK